MADQGYQTAPLVDYYEEFQTLAGNLFSLVQAGLPSGKVKHYKGSYSVFFKRSNETAAKIIIFQEGIGKPIRNWSPTGEGVFVLLRADTRAAQEVRSGDQYRGFEQFLSRINWNVTMGIAPSHEERFHFFQVTPEDSLEAIAASVVSFSQI